MKEEKKPKKNPKIEAAELKPVEIEVEERYPNVKRMITNLDKFLNRRFVGVIGVYISIMLVCGFGLVMSGTVNASSGGTNNMNNAEVWLYSFLAVATFIFAVIVARVITIRIANNRGK